MQKNTKMRTQNAAARTAHSHIKSCLNTVQATQMKHRSPTSRPSMPLHGRANATFVLIAWKPDNVTLCMRIQEKHMLKRTAHGTLQQMYTKARQKQSVIGSLF